MLSVAAFVVLVDGVLEGRWARRAAVRASASRMAWDAPFDPTVQLVSEEIRCGAGLGLTGVHGVCGIAQECQAAETPSGDGI
jgi:hypothetical protein